MLLHVYTFTPIMARILLVYYVYLLSSQMCASADLVAIHWHLIPPHGFNFEGLRESGIKSVKSSLIHEV